MIFGRLPTSASQFQLFEHGILENSRNETFWIASEKSKSKSPCNKLIRPGHTTIMGLKMKTLDKSIKESAISDIASTIMCIRGKV